MLPSRHSNHKLMPLLSSWTGRRLRRQGKALAVQERRYAIMAKKPFVIRVSTQDAPTEGLFLLEGGFLDPMVSRWSSLLKGHA